MSRVSRRGLAAISVHSLPKQRTRFHLPESRGSQRPNRGQAGYAIGRISLSLARTRAIKGDPFTLTVASSSRPIS